MIADPHLPRALWPNGRVVKTPPSPDRHITSADVKVKERIYTRPVAKHAIVISSMSRDNKIWELVLRRF